MAITATVNTTRSVVGSVSQGNQPQVTRVTVPGPKGDTGLAGSAQNQISAASDVDITSFPLQDGSLLQYRQSTGKWTASVNELDIAPNDNAPEPFVLRNSFALPSAVGSVNVTLPPSALGAFSPTKCVPLLVPSLSLICPPVVA